MQRLELVLQRHAVGIRIQAAGQQTDEVDQSPDAAAHTGAAGQHDLDDAVLGIAQIEVVDADAADEEGQQNGYQLGLLAVVGSSGSGSGGKATAGADSRAGLRSNRI